MLRVAEAYSELDPLDRPLVSTMGMSASKPLVESEFGTVQRGSIISYQQPKLHSKNFELHPDAPPYPSLPLEDHNLSQTECVWVCTEEELLHLQSLNVTHDMAHKIEASTREQSAVPEWHVLRKSRITSSRFREVCHVRGLSTSESLAERMLRGTRQTTDMKRGAEMEFEAAKEYAKCAHVNYTPCGLVIHPQAPWLGTSPDGMVYDPTITPSFGLVEIKCPNVKSFVECKYLSMCDGSFQLKRSHAYFWQIQGQLLLTGLTWCFFFFFFFGLKMIILYSAYM